MYKPRHLTVYRAPDKPRAQGRPKLTGPARLYQLSDEDRQKLVKMPSYPFLTNPEATK
jgi:hypothetical protein